jgi:hypothetical protein
LSPLSKMSKEACTRQRDVVPEGWSLSFWTPLDQYGVRMIVMISGLDRLKLRV